MSYEDAIDATITPVQARREIEKHGQNFDDFVQDVGWKAAYLGREILDWLGY